MIHRYGKIIFVFCLLALPLMVAMYEYYLLGHYIEQLASLPDAYSPGTQVCGMIGDEDSVEQSDLEDVLAEGALGFDQTSDEGTGNEGDSDDQDTGFVVVNRSVDYLRESSLEFYKQHNMHHCVDRLADEWECYNEWHLKQRSKENNKLRKTKVKSTRSLPRVPRGVNKRLGSTIRFSWPIDPNYFWLSSLYGPRKRKDGSMGFHHAIDMAAVKGTRVNAARKGRVVEARYTVGWGNTVLIDHLDGRYKTRYAHLDKIHVYVGQQVTKDTWIGNVGATGTIRKKGKDGSHLHFEVYDRGQRIDPLPLLT